VRDGDRQPIAGWSAGHLLTHGRQFSGVQEPSAEMLETPVIERIHT
jgi:hypothetical protein